MQGCATPYQYSDYAGGYSTTQLDKNVFRVSFRGNGFTSRDTVADYTLLRSAEITLKNGYKYFSIVSANEYTNYSSYTSPTTSNTTASVYGYGNSAYVNASTTTYGGQTYNFSKPSSTNTIACFVDKPENIFSYNAEFIANSLSQRYGIDIMSRINIANDFEKRIQFQEKINSISKDILEIPNYKRIPIDSDQDQDWFTTQAFLYWDEKSTKEEFISNGVKKYPEYRETFEYLSDKIRK